VLRAALLALLVFVLAPASARADVLRPAEAPSGATPAPAWVQVAEALALDYAARQGWGDACAGQPIRIDVYRDLDAVQGRPVVAYADLGGECSMAIEAETLATPEAFCDTYVHERLHLVRDDGWHDPVEGHPLYADVVPYAACGEAWRPRLSRAEAVGRVRSKLGRGWRIAVVGRPAGDGASAAYMVAATRRRGVRRRLQRLEFEVWRDRAGAPVAVARVG
jgi:hypothetical protein